MKKIEELMKCELEKVIFKNQSKIEYIEGN